MRSARASVAAYDTHLANRAEVEAANVPDADVIAPEDQDVRLLGIHRFTPFH
jgi:hypothetical protein